MALVRITSLNPWASRYGEVPFKWKKCSQAHHLYWLANHNKNDENNNWKNTRTRRKENENCNKEPSSAQANSDDDDDDHNSNNTNSNSGKKAVNQPINRSTNQPIHQSTNQFITLLTQQKTCWKQPTAKALPRHHPGRWYSPNWN